MAPRCFAVLFVASAVFPSLGASLLHAAPAPVRPPRPVDLSGEWRLESSLLEPAGGELVSSAGFSTAGWHRARVPGTVLGALVEAGVYPDPRVGLDAYRIPDSSDELNAAHGLARFSHLPGRQNPWRDPWWFRREVFLPDRPVGGRAWLELDAINYRAAVWMNGRQIAGPDAVSGMFRRFRIDATHAAVPGRNVIALEVFPVDHPGIPDTQWEVLGADRRYMGKDLMRDVTEIMTIGYDCMMTVPDRNMGIWQDARVRFTGPVDLRDPFVATDLPLPDRSRATLRISADLVNASDSEIEGTLRGTIGGTELRLSTRFALGPGETGTVRFEPPPVLERPELWWPHGHGGQHLYDLDLEVEAGGTISDEERLAFGVREVGHEMHEVEGRHGRRVLINGERVFCRGGYIQPDLLLRQDERRMEAEIRYFVEAGLNLIYFEDIPNPPRPFLELCDRYGLLFGSCFYSCYWLRPGTPYPDDLGLLERCTIDILKRYRNHPSLIFHMAMNEGETKEEVYEMWRRLVLELDGTRWFIPSASYPDDREDVHEWLRKDLPAGMTDIGASYSWAEPEQYFRWVREARNWMFMMEGGSASLPPISSLVRFLPGVHDPSPAGGDRYPLDRDWAHHGANHYYRGYDDAVRRLHGEPDSVVDYCWKGHLVTADQHRSFFEAVNHRLWDVTSGATQWKINACEPSVQWQIFDWYLKPMVSWYSIRKACEPFHVQLDLLDRKASIINLRSAPADGVEVRARALDLDGRVLWEGSAKADIPASSYRDVLEVPEPDGATPVWLLDLEARGSDDSLASESLYWLRRSGVEDYRALADLPPVRLDATLAVEGDARDDKVATVRLRNPTAHPAFFVQLALLRGEGGAEIVPVLWDDNYFTLLPGEAREVRARFAAKDSGPGGRATLEVGGWNIETPCRCVALAPARAELRAGEELEVVAEIGETFLDGSRVWLRVDGRPRASRWAWARDGRTHRVSFRTRIEAPGPHEISVGDRTAAVSVR